MQTRFHQKVILLNEANEFLVLKASYKGKRWDLPGGGVDLPELHMDALHHELQEEAGITMEDIVPIEVQTAYDKKDDLYYLFIGYKARAISGSIQLGNEHTEYRWVTTKEFAELEVTPYLVDFVNKSLVSR